MPGTSIKDALAKWKAASGADPAEAEEISLIFLMPPIDKMDTRLDFKFIEFITGSL